MSLEKYKNFLEKAIYYYHHKAEFVKYFDKVPLNRYHTFDYCLNYLNNINECKILELGTSRSFVDGRFEGCNLDDRKYWEPNNPEKWDWSAGFFTRVFSELTNDDADLTTVDICKSHLERCKIMTEDYSDKINYIHTDSLTFLSVQEENSFDLIYMDAGDITPINETAVLHLEEAEIIVNRNLLKDGGIILIDDVKSVVPKQHGEKSEYGKAKLSIPYFLENDFEIIMDGYQVVLKKIAK